MFGLSFYFLRVSTRVATTTNECGQFTVFAKINDTDINVFCAVFFIRKELVKHFFSSFIRKENENGNKIIEYFQDCNLVSSSHNLFLLAE